MEKPYISVRDLSYTIANWRSKVKILQNVSLNFYSGHIYAIIGSSGAGKTTLLNTIAGRLGGKGGKIDGRVLFDPKVSSNKTSSYIIQEDVIPMDFNPREILRYSADFKLKRAVSRKEKKEIVEQLLTELNLLSCANNKVGSPEDVHGVSGGERKRVSIGIGILHNPKILYLDEPTSGLDSSAAYNVVKSLKSLCFDDRLILATIHQPSMEILSMFTNVIVLSLGRVVFAGPLESIIPYFYQIGIEFPRHVNIADCLMDLTDTKTREVERYQLGIRPSGDLSSFEVRESPELTAEERVSFCMLDDTSEGKLGLDRNANAPSHERELSVVVKEGVEEDAEANGIEFGNEIVKEVDPNVLPEKRDVNRIKWLNHRYRESPLCINEDQRFEDHESEMVPRGMRTRTSRNFFYQLFTLLRRDSSALRKNRKFIAVKIMQTIIITAATGLLFFQVDDNQAGIRARMGYAFFALMANLLFGMIGVLFVLPRETPVFFRESLDGFYGTIAYFTAKNLIDTPIQFISPVVFSLVSYNLVGLPLDVFSFLLFALVVIQMANVGASFGFFISVMVKDLTSALAFLPAVFIPMVLFAGFVVDVDTIPIVISWIQYIDPVKYAFELCVYAIFQSNPSFECLPGELVQGLCLLNNGESVLKLYGYDDIPVIPYLIIMFFFIFIIRTFAFYILTMKAESQKSK